MADETTNEVSITSITHATDGRVILELLGPPTQLILMEWSDDLVTWHPLHEYEILDPPQTIRVVYVTDSSGHATVPDTPLATEDRKYYRAILWYPPIVWPPPEPIESGE